MNMEIVILIVIKIVKTALKTQFIVRFLLILKKLRYVKKLAKNKIIKKKV